MKCEKNEKRIWALLHGLKEDPVLGKHIEDCEKCAGLWKRLSQEHQDLGDTFETMDAWYTTIEQNTIAAIRTAPEMGVSLVISQRLRVPTVREVADRLVEVTQRVPRYRKVIYATSVVVALGVLLLTLQFGSGLIPGKEATYFAAAWQNNVEAVQSMLDDNPGLVHTRDSATNNIALHIAAEKGFYPMAALLLSRGSNVDARGYHSNTPLHLSASAGHDDLVKLLLDHGADPNAKNDEKQTPLEMAIREGHSKVVDLLLQATTRKNAPAPEAQNQEESEKHGTVPLSEAARFAAILESQQWDTAKAMLEANPALANPMDPLAPSFERPMIFRDRGPLVRTDPPGGLAKTPYTYGETPLIMAARAGSKETVKALLNHGANALLKNSSPMEDPIGVKGTALMHATAQGKLEIVQLLVDHWLSHSSPDSPTTQVYFNEALSIAAKQGDKQIAEYLLERGARPGQYTRHRDSEPDLFGRKVRQYQPEAQSALGYAVGFNHLEIAQMLLRHGIDVDTPRHGLITPLEGASKSENREMVRLLQEYQEIKLKTFPAFLKALDAKDWGTSTRLLKRTPSLLLQKGGEGKAPLAIAAEQGWSEAVQFLLKNGAEPHYFDWGRRNALHLAADRGNTQAVHILLKSMKSVSDRTDNDQTPLFLAIDSGHPEVVRLLLEAGANSNEFYGTSQRTALQIGAQRGHFEIVRLLLEAGSKVNVEDQNGMTALDWAEKNGHAEVAELLRKSQSDQGKNSNDEKTED